MTRKALGRGLSALIPDPPPATPAAEPSARETTKRDYFLCPIEQIRPDRRQPRQHFDEKLLAELVQSIRQVGMVQPLIVRQVGDGYVLVAGERRWRAAQRVGLARVPVVVRDVSDDRALEMALVENLQRADLNPIEEAEAYQRLIDAHGQTQAQLAERVGRDRTTITNALRLLVLPDAVKRALIRGTTTAGHARALLALPSPEAMTTALRHIEAQGLSVRQTEAYIKRLTQPPKPEPGASLSANARALQERLGQSLKTRVRLAVGPKGSGRIDIYYGSLDELDRLLKVLLP